MWKNPFGSNFSSFPEGDAKHGTFAEAQAWVNFVVLRPTVLPAGCEWAKLTVREETETVRSSVRFVVEGRSRALRVKQFFYDWSYPAVLADTNLVAQGQPFVACDVVGHLGTDYKGHVAACHSRWFTQIEISVLHGTFEEAELLALIAGLTPARAEAVETIGLLPFAVTSHTARFHQPALGWGVDQVTRADWMSADLELLAEVGGGHLLPPTEFGAYRADSFGYQVYTEGEDAQLILRSLRNGTDCIYTWSAPERRSESVPPKYGSRQKWQVEQRTLTLHQRGEALDVWLAEQLPEGDAPPLGGWRAHWKRGGMSYHVHVRPSTAFTLDELVEFVKRYA